MELIEAPQAIHLDPNVTTSSAAAQLHAKRPVQALQKIRGSRHWTGYACFREIRVFLRIFTLAQ